MNKKIGFTIGKFSPYHIGHKYLITTALKNMDDFYVVVYDTPEYIDINKKIKWIKNDFPNIKILEAYNSPKQYGLDEKSVKIQMEYLYKIIKDKNVNYFYSSEPYGEFVADYLKIENVLVDPERKIYNISATNIRKNIEKYKMFINEDVYSDIKNL